MMETLASTTESISEARIEAEPVWIRAKLLMTIRTKTVATGRSTGDQGHSGADIGVG
jgi:hypothetical protein